MERIGRYEILSKIGEGGMGVVYKARHPTLDMIVAVKTISTSMDTTPEIRKRFHIEARSAAQLSHENIIRIFDYDEYKGKAYLVLEFLEGDDLKAEINRIINKKRSPLSLNQSLQIMTGVCKGLAHAHDRGIYHRDIKPANIFITDAGQVKILDFGLAKMVSTQVTVTGMQMGTVAYMSPEQVDGQPFDQRSDIFSAGVLFYELLSYRQPFTGEAWSEILYKIVHSDPTPLETLNPYIPQELSAIIKKAMAKDKAKRYQSMQELLDDLELFRQELEERKRELRNKTSDVIVKLEKLIEENQDLLQRPAEELEAAKQEAPTVFYSLGISGEPGDLGKLSRSSLDYLEVAEIYERARQEYEQLDSIVQKREIFDALLAEAESGIRKNDLDVALKAVEKILLDVPAHPKAIELKEQVSKKLKAAQSEATKRRRAEEFFNLAQTSFSTEDYAGCIAFSAEVLRLIPSHNQAISLLESAQQKLKDIARQEEILRKANGELAAARDALAAGKYDQARAAVQTARELCPDLQDASGLLTEIRNAEQAEEEARIREELERKVDDLFQKAKSFLEQEQEDSAVRILNEIREIAPDTRKGEELAAEIEKLRQKRERALREQEERISNMLKRAREAEQSGELEKAVELAELILTQDVSHGGARELISRVAAEINRRRREEEERQKKIGKLLLLAQDAESRGQFKEAVKTLNDILAMDNQRQDVLDMRRNLQVKLEAGQRKQKGLELLEREDFQDALASLKNAQETLKEDPEIHWAIARAEELIQEEERRQTVRSAIADAQAALSRESLEEASGHINEVLRLDPDNADAGELQSLLDQAIRERQLRGKIASHLAACHQALSREDFAESTELANKVLMLDRDNSEARELLDRIDKAQRQKLSREKIASLLAQSSKALSSENFEEADARAREVLFLDPGNSEAKNLIRQIQETQGKRHVRKKIASLLADARASLGRGQPEDAVPALEEALQLDPENKTVSSLLDKVEEDIRIQDRTRKTERIEEFLEQSRQARSTGRYPEALKLLDEVLSLDSSRRDVKQLRRQIAAEFDAHKTKQDQIAEAEREKQEGLKMLAQKRFQESLAALKRAGKILGTQEELESAISEAEAGLKSQELHSRIQSDLASALGKEDFDKAESVANEILYLDPQNDHAREILNQVEGARKEKEKKDRVAELVRLSRESMEREDFDQSLDYAGRALQLDPQNAQPKELLKQVEELRRLKYKRAGTAKMLAQSNDALRKRNFEDAEAKVREVLLLDEQNAEARSLLKRINEAQEKWQKENQITKMLIEAHDARDKQQFEIALDRITKILQLDSGHKEARSLAKNIERERRAFEKQRLRQARTVPGWTGNGEAAATVIVAKPKSYIYRALKLAGIVIAACILLLAAYRISLWRSEDRSRFQQVQVLLDKGKYQTAKQLLGNWLRQDPENAEAQKMLKETDAVLSELSTFESAKSQGNFNKAMEALGRISKAYPTDPELPQRRQKLEELFSQPFSDPFIEGLGSWNAPDSWKIVNNRLSVGNGIGYIWGRYYRDFEADFNIQFVRKDTASWILRVENERDYYLFQLTGPNGSPPNSISGYLFRDGRKVKTLLQPRGVGLNLGTRNAQFRIRIRAQGNKITHLIANATAPEEQEQGPYEIIDDTYHGGTFGFKAADNVEFYVFGPLIMYSSKNGSG